MAFTISKFGIIFIYIYILFYFLYLYIWGYSKEKPNRKICPRCFWRRLEEEVNWLCCKGAVVEENSFISRKRGITKRTTLEFRLIGFPFLPFFSGSHFVHVSFYAQHINRVGLDDDGGPSHLGANLQILSDSVLSCKGAALKRTKDKRLGQKKHFYKGAPVSIIIQVSSYIQGNKFRFFGCLELSELYNIRNCNAI